MRRPTLSDESDACILASSSIPTSLAKYGRLALVARNLVEGFLTGVHKSPYKGFSVEFAEHRQYYPGDEIRHIDWRAFGKTDRYYIKEYEEETNLKAHLLVDASGSMAYKGKHRSKFEYAQYIAASLAYLMLHQRDAVGLAMHDTQDPPAHPAARPTPSICCTCCNALEQTAARRRDEPGAAVASSWPAVQAPRPGRHPVGLLRPRAGRCCGRCGTSATGGTRCCCSTSSRRRRSSSLQEVDAVPQPGSRRPQAAGRSAAAAQGVPAELPDASARSCATQAGRCRSITT